MPSFLKTFANMVRGKKDEMAKKMADPVRDGKIAIEDSEKQVAQFTEKIAKLMAETKRLTRQRDDAKADIDKYTNIAQQAAQAGAEDDVRKAVEMKNQAQQRYDSLDSEVKRNEQLVQNLRQQLTKARAKVAQAKSSMTSLSARMEGAKVRQELGKAASEFNAGSSPLAALDDLEKSVQSKESEAEAWEEMVGAEEEASGASLEEKYKGGGTASVDSEVAELMQKAKTTQ